MIQKLFALSLTVLLIAGCGSSGGELKQASLSFEVLSTASTTTAPSTSLSGKAVAPYGQATSGDVTSMQYYIYEISICKDMTITGTGYSGASGCIVIFSADQLYDYNTFNAEQAASETEHYIDIMSASDLARLAKTVYLSADDIGEYYYGKVDHYRPVKVTASVPISASTTLYTKDGTSRLVSGSGIDARYIWDVSDMNAGPTAQSIVVLPNGGSWFKFENPLVITDADVENETTFNMKLAFNMDDVIKGYSYTSSNQAIQDETGNFGMVVPIMAFTPVVYRTTETAMKESYLLYHTNTGASDYASFDFRLEIYYVDGDASDTIYAADTLRLLTLDDSVGTAVTQIYRPFTVSSSSATPPVYSFYNYLETAFLTNFTRGTQVGDTGTATFVQDGNDISLDVILNAIDTIEADSTINTISAADLNGIWTGSCIASAPGSYKNTYTFNLGQYTLTRTNYSDASCATTTGTVVTTYAFVLAGKTTDTGGEEVKEINLTNNDTGSMLYDIYMTDGTQLFFGTSPSSTEAGRPTTLGSAVATFTGPVNN